MLSRFAETFIRYRLVVAAVALFATVVALVGVTRVSIDDDPRGTFRSDDAEFRFMEEIFEQFGSDENDVILLVESNSLFARGALHDLQYLVADVEKIDGIQDVLSLVDERFILITPFPHPLIPRLPRQEKPEADEHWLVESFWAVGCIRAKHEAREHPMVSKYLLSKDGRSTVVLARLKGDNPSATQIKRVATELRKTIKKWNERGNLHVTMTGLPIVRSDIFSVLASESIKFSLLAMIAAVIISFWLFRRIALVIIVCAAPTFALIWTIGALGLFGVQINVFTMQLPCLVEVISFTDAIHLAVHLRHCRAEGQAPKEAAKSTLERMIAPCALTSLTTAIGFGSLYLTKTEIIQNFGVTCAAGAVIAFLAGITMVPLLASTWLSKHILRKTTQPTLVNWSKVSNVFSDTIYRCRWAITVGAGVLIVVLGVTVSHLTVDHRLSEFLPPDSETSQALQKVDAQFGGSMAAYVLVEWPETWPKSPVLGPAYLIGQVAGARTLAGMSAPPVLTALRVSESDAFVIRLTSDSPPVHQAIAEVSRICGQHFYAPISILDVTKDMPTRVPAKIRRRFVNEDARRALVIARVRDRGAIVHKKTSAELSNEFAELENRFSGFRFRVSGTSMVASRTTDRMITDLAQSLGLAVFIIFGVMVVAYRSLRLSLIAIIPNGLPLLITASVLVWIGEPLRFASVIVFSICLGIAVDDTIHFLSRFRHEFAVDGDKQAAIRRTYQAISSALLISTLALVAGFSVLLISVLPSTQTFATFAMVAIGSALLGDLLILPAILACFVKSSGGTAVKPR